MSRSPSPASSLDFYDSDPSSEEAYTPRRRAPTKRNGALANAVAGPSNGGAKTTKIRINLGSLRVSRDVAAQHPADGEVEEDENAQFDGEEDGLLDSRIVDLSQQGLVKDHHIRPLWVDEDGNMYVIHFMSRVVIDILAAFSKLSRL